MDMYSFFPVSNRTICFLGLLYCLASQVMAMMLLGCFVFALVLLVRVASTESGANRADVVILKPEANSNVHYGGEIAFTIGIVLHPGSKLLHRTYICIHEVGSTAEELCVEQGSFTLSGFVSGTHVITASVRTFANDHDFQQGIYELMGSAEVLVDTIDSPYLLNHARDSGLSHRILQSNVHMSRFDYLYLPNTAVGKLPYHNINLLAGDYKIIGRLVVAAEQAVVDPQFAGLSHTTRVRVPRKIAIFMTTVANIPPSDRYKDWLCEHAAFAEHGYELSVITANNAIDNGVRDICGVAVQRFKCVSLDHANTRTVTAEDLQLHHASAQDSPQLAAYLSTVDVVIIGNTYGDVQTSLLLDVIHMMRAVHKAGVSGVLNGKVPRVMIDLPNLEVPSDWQGEIDALIAPSKATGLHRLSISLCKPIAVIYPPVRDNVINASLCAEQYHCAMHGTCNTTTASATTATIVTGATTDSSVLDISVFNFLFVGRLAAVKCPGLIVRTLGYLLRSTYWSALASDVLVGVAAEGDQQDEMVAEVDREFYAELVKVSRIFASDITDDSTAIQHLLTVFRANTHTTLIGSGELLVLSALQRLAFSLNVSGVVTFAGPQEPEKVIKYMQQADVLVNPIVRGETFGFIHIEAAAQGLPVIAFNMSANSESILNMDANSQGVRFDASVGRILPFRDKYVIQDLALAILKTFVNSASIVNSIDSSAATDADVQSTDVNVDAGVHNNMQMQPRYVYSNRIRNVSAICEGVLPMFAHWNVKQHAKALIHAVDELLS